jgi:pyruvate/2-oxoglutarate dehydrogenase complex dihydrolipoamide acyltransferase (E2) component
MSQKLGPYHLVELPPPRRETASLLDLYWWKHCVYGLIEVDVTVARQFIEAHKAQTGEALSFTGYLTFCLARAVDEDKAVQAFMKGRKQLVVFDDVDVGITVERQMGGTRAPMGHVIRRANHKTFLEIHQEIRSVQTQPVPPNKGMSSWLRLGLLLPGPLSKLFIALLRAAIQRDPTVLVAQAGTVGVTAVGMFSHGHSSGWGLTPAAHSLVLVVGGIARKPAVVEDRIEPREILHLTVGFDHDVVDGAPAARFVQRLVELIESGYGLAEDPQARHADPEPTAGVPSVGQIK